MWKVVSYVKTGLSHEQKGIECQDKVCIVENNVWLVASLADGVGSLKYSHIAAEEATKTVCEVLSDEEIYKKDTYNSKDIGKYILGKIRNVISNRVIELNISEDELDCTLLFVVINKTENYAYVGRIGDSALIILREEDSEVLCDFNTSANRTDAILSGDALEKIQISSIDIEKEKILGFLLSSDGLDNVLYMKGSSHVNKVTEEYFNSVNLSANIELAREEIKEKIIRLVENENTYYDDDISIVVISNTNKKFELPPDPTWLCSCGERNSLSSTYCHKCNMDFAKLYKNIRFRHYGGKTAFFIDINRNLDRELELIGLKNDNNSTEEKDNDLIDNQENDINLDSEKKEENNIDDSDEINLIDMKSKSRLYSDKIYEKIIVGVVFCICICAIILFIILK